MSAVTRKMLRHDAYCVNTPPTGAPMSLVPLHEPDFARFPRFRAALAAAVSAELGPISPDDPRVAPLYADFIRDLKRIHQIAA